MAAQIFEKGKSIVFENKFTEIHISKKDASVEKIIDKKTNKDIKGEDTKFFYFSDSEREALPSTGASLTGDIITLSAEFGSVDIEAKAFDNYFTFEVKTEIPEGAYRLTVAHAKYNYEYDRKEKGRTMATGISMTIWMNPVFFPDAKQSETRGEVSRHLGSVEAKYGLLIAPYGEHYEILREMYRTVDREKGIVSSTGGVFARDHRPNFANYTIQYDTSKDYIKNNVEYYKSLGVGQIDFHGGLGKSHNVGDYKFAMYPNSAEFKKNVADVLEEAGISIGLHTFTQYMTASCDEMLSDPENQKMLHVKKTFTLAEDVTDESEYIEVVEGEYPLPDDPIDRRRERPYFLIGEEIIYFERKDNRIKILRRGCSGTKKSDHKKGELAKHLQGFHGLSGKPGSRLFYDVARNIARAYNEGGFKMIYLDALDGIFRDAPKEDYWFYTASFAHEVLKNCNSDPIMEAADFVPSMYAFRGRSGAYDFIFRSYKSFNNRHVEVNKMFLDRYITSTLGWYHFYPTVDEYPGNEFAKYHHVDAVEHMGSLGIMYDFSTVYMGMKREMYERCAGLRRNVELYRKYDNLRQSQYFSEEYREKMKSSPYELHLLEKRGGKYSFIEKDYQIKKLLDLSDEERNFGEFKNPFGRQMPFVRIEALLSTAKDNGFIVMKMNENVDITEQKLSIRYGTSIDLKDNLAKVVRVKGNGIEGGKIGITFRSDSTETSYDLFVIDTNFEGWREFVLIECDNGEKFDHHFEDKYHFYAVHRGGFNHAKTTGADIFTEGDVTGVRMSDIVAYQHTYDVLKNPTVRIKDTSIMFECELQSSDFIEFDGKTAKVIDRYGNEKEIFFKSEGFLAPRGRFEATLEVKSLNRFVPRAQLTLGFTGKEIK